VATWTEIQQRLGAALDANRPGSGIPHVLISVPSFSLAESLLAHYADRIPALEHRYLLALPVLERIPECEMVYVCSVAPSPAVLDYLFSLLSPGVRADCRRRFRVVTLDDPSARGVAAKLLERPDLVAQVRAVVGGRPALIEPWNVTSAEVRLAEALEVPVNGTSPDLWHLGFKSAGRRLLRGAGVPVPEGAEDLHSVEEVAAAVADLRVARPQCTAVVVKTDDSAAGDGNRVLRLSPGVDVVASLRRLPAWYLDDLAGGGVVEELLTGDRFTSPSVQLDVVPGGRVRLLATHEQVLGGDEAQVYLGCRFPADDAYVAELGRYGRAAGRALAAAGIIGRVGLDFAAVGAEDGDWDLRALELNLRKGGTTHPFAALRNLVPGDYDADAGRWVAADGRHCFYESTDNLVDPSWRGRDPEEVMATVGGAGLGFDRTSGTGVVLHMLSGLAVDGRMGLTAFATSRAGAADLFARAGEVLRG
jgi:hypothetical protein